MYKRNTRKMMSIGRGTTCCTDGWLAFESSCYMFGKDVAAFTVAEQYCRQHGGHLIHVDNNHENNFIKDRLRDLKASHFWSGLTDEDIEGTWVWFDTDTNATFVDFYTGYGGHNNIADCVIFAYNLDYSWIDYACSSAAAKPLCERPSESCSCESTSANVIVG
ncbi:perlucin-like protein isoform X2 [Dreissena polymorpha]|uniref:perlucin-like protein isoform X2 n=1 Tax=Dreissena polymorpha TaxID=45954 RepID=UPI002264109E|nr:perlucin-like protein isoform X2 [Dreissena polymorpha]